MTTRGVHFALSVADARKVLAATDPDDLVELIAILEEQYLQTGEWSFQLDQGWDALHRCLTDGQLLYASGPFPLAYAVLGGRPLDAGEDYTACLVEPPRLAETAAALAGVTHEWLRSRYFALDPGAYASALTDEDFDYIWSCFQGLPEFFARAAAAKRAVLFTTDC